MIIEFNAQQAIELHGDAATAKVVLQCFVADLLAAKPRLEKLYTQKDWDALRRALHKLHGVGLYVCTTTLNQHLRILQTLLCENTINENALATQYQAMKIAMQAVMVFSPSKTN